MLFTAKEMEIICVFYAGTLSKTLETLKSIVSGIAFQERKADCENAVRKLSAMSVGDTVSLAFEPE